MNRPAFWFDELQAMAARFSALGITPDIAGLTLAEAWGLFVFLRRIAQGGGA